MRGLLADRTGGVVTMPDTRLLAPILTPAMTEEQLQGVAEVVLEWAGAKWHQATVDDLQHAQAHQKRYLDALQRERAERHNTAAVVNLTAYRKART